MVITHHKTLPSLLLLPHTPMGLVGSLNCGLKAGDIVVKDYIILYKVLMYNSRGLLYYLLILRSNVLWVFS